MLIYKIFRAPEWDLLERTGQTQGAPVDLADGYIHFSTADQAAETAAKHFAGEDNLILVAFDASLFGDALKWEPSRGGALFPHLYRPLDRSDVLWHVPLPLLGGAHAFPEPIAGHIDPTRAQFDRFKARDRAEPVQMLNLLRLRDKAAYPKDHELAQARHSGADAYALYGRQAAPIFARVGGSIHWRGSVGDVLIGPQSEHWDIAFIASYPDAHAFLAMVTDPAYQEAALHRQAAVATSRLIPMSPAPPGASFG